MAANSSNKTRKASKKRASANTGKKSKTKSDLIIARLRRKNGASINDLVDATGWQAHSVRGFLSGTIKKKLGLDLISEKQSDGTLRYYLKDA
jgi:hypothetical protein